LAAKQRQDIRNYFFYAI